MKPAHEPIVLARRPFRGSVAANVVEHGTAAINVRDCSVGDEARHNPSTGNRDLANRVTVTPISKHSEFGGRETNGRWPANVLHDGSFDVLEAFGRNMAASRFFYAAKADKADREFGLDAMPKIRMAERTAHDRDRMNRNVHPTVKPIDLMRWLSRLVTPSGGTVLEPFMGSGSTGIACVREGFSFVGIEQNPDYFDIACRRVAAAVDEAARMPDLVVQVDRAVAAIRAAKQLDLELSS